MNNSVLIIDDSLTIRVELGEAFESAGFDPYLVPSLASARQMLSREQFQIIVLDVFLQDGSGIDFLQELKADPVLCKVPVMMLSGDAELSGRIRGLRTGADEYVGKPYNLSYVVCRAHELVRRSELREVVAQPLVLVIDDSPTLRIWLKESLKTLGLRTLLASTGEEGLRLAGAARPDLMIVDGALPGIDGVTVVKQMRMDPALQNIPCLYLTSAQASGVEFNALEAGADSFVRKGEAIELIMAKVENLLRHSERGMNLPSESQFGPKKILVVDHDASYLEQLTLQLREEGFDVATTSSPSEALEFLAVQEADLVLLDWTLPGFSTKDFCLTVRDSAVWTNVPLIIGTGYEAKDAVMSSLNAGADDFIVKSSDFDLLRARVRAQLRRRHLETARRRAREDLIRKEVEIARGKVAHELAETRAALLSSLEQKNQELELARAHAERDSQFREQLVSIASHDLKNPIAAIALKAQLILKHLDPSLPGHRSIIRGTEGIMSCVHRMQKLIDNVLDTSKVEAGRLAIEPIDCEVEALVAEATELLGPIAREKKILFETQVQSSRGLLRCDEERVLQVLSNLIGNAIKFTESGGRVQLNVQPSDGMVLFEVRDSGVGIPSEDLPHIFDRFWQVKKTARLGAGLGLSISKGIVEAHQGRIWVESKVGEGTTFYFTIPLFS